MQHSDFRRIVVLGVIQGEVLALTLRQVLDCAEVLLLVVLFEAWSFHHSRHELPFLPIVILFHDDCRRLLEREERFLTVIDSIATITFEHDGSSLPKAFRPLLVVQQIAELHRCQLCFDRAANILFIRRSAVVRGRDHPVKDVAGLALFLIHYLS